MTVEAVGKHRGREIVVTVERKRNTQPGREKGELTRDMEAQSVCEDLQIKRQKTCVRLLNLLPNDYVMSDKTQ